MPRRRVVAKREVLPDPKFGNVTLAKFMNHVMVSGKKSVAESIVYGALSLVEERTKRDPIEVFDEALENIAPMELLSTLQYLTLFLFNSSALCGIVISVLWVL